MTDHPQTAHSVERQETKIEILFVLLTLLLGLTAAFVSEPSFKPWLWGAAFFTGGYFGVLGAWEALRERRVDVDLLMLLAALGAATVGRPMEGAVLLFLFSLSNVLQNYALDRTRHAIAGLMKLRPDKALRKTAQGTETVRIEELSVGDWIVVRPGESIPLDGVIGEGESTLDESSLTGESMPVNKTLGDTVFAGTLNQAGALEIKVTRLAKDSTVARMISLVESARNEKARTQTFLDQAEQYYALGVLGLTALLILLPPLLFHDTWQHAFYRAMTVMVVASPCALVISTPASILSAIGAAAKRGVLFKGGIHLERAAAIQIVALDKTGTLTEGRPRVTEVVMVGESLAKQELVQIAAGVEAKSEHPLAAAIVHEAQSAGLSIPECTEFQSIVSQGAMGTINGKRIGVGSERIVAGLSCDRIECARLETTMLQNQGKTVIWVVRIDLENKTASILGLIAVADVVRPEAREVVESLKKMGIKQIVMLTGDNKRVAAAIAKQVGIENFYAEMRPEDKVRLVRELGQQGPVIMVGDGVNDAPALATASIGIAMGAAGTDVAMETADVVLMNSNLKNIPFAIAIGRRAQRVVYQNLIFAMAVILLLLAGALGWALPLPIGVVAHEGSTVLVCLNGLRLLLFKG